MIYRFANVLCGRLRGALGHVNVLGSLIFSGMTGSGFEPAFSCSITAASATLGPIFPPSIPLVFVPIMVPVAAAPGIDLIHFGLAVTFNMMIGLSTPPFGMLLFITSGLSGIPLKDIAREILWPIVVMIIVLLIITYLPDMVLDTAGGRIKVIASGHTADDPGRQIDELGRMAGTGVDAVVLVSNRLAGREEGEEALRRRAEAIFTRLPGVTFGMYECPYPYLRLLSTSFLAECTAAVRGGDLGIFNANTATLLDSLIAGAAGFSGVMANFHPELYKWLYTRFAEQPQLARRVSDFLTVAAVAEGRAYPVNAKYHLNAVGVPMSLVTRSRDAACLNENAVHEMESLIRMEDALRGELGLYLPLPALGIGRPWSRAHR